MKKYFFIAFFLVALFFVPKSVYAQQYNRTASVGRSAVMNTSSVYYYTDWKLLSDNSLNSTPIPYSGGDYYHMGSEYSFPITLVGDTSFRGQVKIPVVANTIYNFQLMNGLGANDMKFGLHQNWGVYGNLADITVQNSVWECQTYPHLGVAHNYCNYIIDFTFHLTDAWTGAYNLNVAVLDTTGTRSAYYYSGYDSNGNAIEFPVASQNSGYPTLQPSLTMSSTGGSSGSGDNTDEILDGISTATDAINDTIQESYENLVKSQEVCSSRTFIIDYSNYESFSQGYLNRSSGNIQTSSSNRTSDYLDISNSNSLIFVSGNNNSTYCFYDSSKSYISCDYVNGNLIVPNNAYYFRMSSPVGENYFSKLSYNFCQNGNQAIYDFSTEPFDDNIGGTIFEGVDWYENSHFSSIITAPISFLNSLNDSCTPLTLTYRGQDITLPCGTTIFWELDNSYISNFRIFWNLLFGGLIIYRLGLKLVMTINDVLDPTKDEIGGFDI